MKRIHFFALSILAAISLASCGNEDAAQGLLTEKTEDLTGLTEFAPQETASSSATRTTGEYGTNSLSFYWTKGDKIWLHDETATPKLVQSIRDNIESQAQASGANKVAHAKFYFPDAFKKAKYPVRYTGYGNPAGDKVTIKNVQAQAKPNQGEHIGTDGDCGVGVASRGSDGRYTFTLSHQAAYLTFTPYHSKAFSSDVKVTKIKVTANQTLAGTFDFNDNGIVLSSRPAANESNKSITLTLNGGGNNGFNVPTAASVAENAAIMVLAPGCYTNFIVQYTIYDTRTKVCGTVCKNYGSIKLTAGKNRRVTIDLCLQRYDRNLYYMWDAKAGEHYWKGVANPPSLLDETNANYPKTSSDSRWFNPADYNTPASYTAKNNPNANELLWLLRYGNAHWDNSTWTIMGHLYRGGMWLKKLDVIAKELGKTRAQMKVTSPNNIDFTKIQNQNYDAFVQDNHTVTRGKPAKQSDYFYLPAAGHFTLGKFMKVGVRGYIWSSTPRPKGTANVPQGYNLYVSESGVHTGYGDRTNGFYLCPAH